MDTLDQYPAAVNGGLAIILAALTPWLLKHGISADSANAILKDVLGLGTAVLAVWRVFVIHKTVTPVANPKNNVGQPLVPAPITGPAPVVLPSTANTTPVQVSTTEIPPVTPPTP